jgi:hypothetical protein
VGRITPRSAPFVAAAFGGWLTLVGSYHGGLRVSAPGLVSATLAELGGDERLDIMVRETPEQARAAQEIAAATPAFARWGEQHVASIGPRYHGAIRSAVDG